MENDKFRKAQARVRQLKGFYSNLISYIVINLVLVVINLVTSPDALWFYWVSIFWGIAILIEAVHVFTIKGKFLGKQWEEKKVKELMEKE